MSIKVGLPESPLFKLKDVNSKGKICNCVGKDALSDAFRVVEKQVEY